MTSDASPTPIAASAATRTHRQAATAVIVVVVLSGIALTPFAQQPLPPVPSYMLAFGFAMVITNLLLAALMFSRGLSEFVGGSNQLGNAYWFVAVLFLSLIALYP